MTAKVPTKRGGAQDREDSASKRVKGRSKDFKSGVNRRVRERAQLNEENRMDHNFQEVPAKLRDLSEIVLKSAANLN